MSGPERCETCRHWNRQGSPLSRAARNPASSPEEGTCQIGQAVLFMINGFPEGVWPVMHATRFCEEWEAPAGHGPTGGEEVDPVSGQIVVPIGAGAKSRAVERIPAAAVRR